MSENSMKEKLEAIVKKAMASMNTANSLDALNEMCIRDRRGTGTGWGDGLCDAGSGQRILLFLRFRYGRQRSL